MQEKGNGNEPYSFINERRKEKPVNKKRLMIYAVFIVVMAVVFGMTASFVFTWFRPKFEEMLYPGEQNVVKIPKDYPDTTETEPQETESLYSDTETITDETDTEMLDATEQEPTEEGSEDQTESTQTVTEPIVKELTIADFQQIQNQLYDIGREANRFLVTVTGVKSDTDWFQNNYERRDQISGIIIADNGTELLILTEKSRIEDAQEIYVTFNGGYKAEAFMKKYDGNTGISVLSVPMESLDETTADSVSAAVLGNSLITKQGELVVAAGSALGSNSSVLTGTITSVDNSISTVDSKYTVFTTNIVGSRDGSGVLLNVNGEIIGLVMQQYSFGDEGTLKAVSISELKSMIEMLSNNMDMPYIGVELTTVTAAIASEYDIPKGAYIKDVRMDSPAMAAGLQSGDVITELDGDVVFTVEGFQNKLLSMVPGETVEIVVKRQGSEGYARIQCEVEVGILQ